jgi:hypothetical protein
MGKILTGSILVFFVAGMTLAGFLILNENPELIQGEKPVYNVETAKMKLDVAGHYEQFIFTLNISQGSVSIIGVNHNFFKWQLTGEFNKTVSNGKIAFSMQYIGLGTRIKPLDNLDSYFVQILLSDGNIITWKFNQEIQMDFIP